MKKKHFIDSHKVATAFAIIALMYWFDTWDNVTAWVYFGMHGAYGFMWFMKSRMFADKQWEADCSLFYGLYIWGGLTGYWIAPYLILSSGFEAQPWYLGMCIFIFVIGVFYHFAADMQKHTHLKLNPGHLITDGIWARSRNPNYFGELLIYLGFTLLAGHWLPVAWLGMVILLEWIPNMRAKEKSLSRYPEFAAYKKQSAIIIPFLF